MEAIISRAMSAQLPLIISETSKAVASMMAQEKLMADDLKRIKQKQTDLALEMRAAALNSLENKSQFLAFASLKSFMDTSTTHIDDLQLKEEELTLKCTQHLIQLNKIFQMH
jgi:hypothetical protein